MLNNKNKKTRIIKPKKRFLQALLFAGVASVIPLAQADVINVEDNSTVTANISALDATRIAVVGDRITLVRGTANAYTVSNDTVQGAVFIKPFHAVPCEKGHQPALTQHSKNKSKAICPLTPKFLSPFYLFVSTEQGRNYLLHLTPQRQQSAELLVLKSVEIEKTAALAWEKSDHYSQTLIQLVAAILNHQAPNGYVETQLSQDFTFGPPIHLHLSQRFTGAHLIADVYQVVNHAQHSVRLTESGFYQPGDRAIFLKRSTLAPQESTVLIKVRNVP
jgi:type-F conjugative transfer system secretin TraK